MENETLKNQECYRNVPEKRSAAFQIRIFAIIQSEKLKFLKNNSA